MAALPVPANGPPTGDTPRNGDATGFALLRPLSQAGASPRDRIAAFLAQPAVRRSLPMVAGLGLLVVALLLWMAMSSGPQRVLYSSLGDGERASVVETLESAGIDYTIDNDTGALSVSEDDLYRARMLVASDGALAVPETGAQMLDAIPIGSSRTLEGERLRNVRERELMLTIAEIDGVEAVRVHLAQPERSVFVRDNLAPGASVMVRMARGRSLADDQVRAIVNLVAGSVPGMSPDAVRVADQHGRLLSDVTSQGGSALEVQSQYEDKLRAQIAQLLVPMLGEGNFTSEVQVELDMAEVTSARESYDKDGAIRTETESQMESTGAGPMAGVPGVLSNTPPPPTGIEDGAPEGTAPTPPMQTTGESSARRTYELGREVAVSSNGPGGVKRLSVAVAISQEALAAIAPATGANIERLVASAVGAQTDRGDEVTVVTGGFEAAAMEEAPFWETAWFATVLRNVVALIAVILALVFGVRPIVKALKERNPVADPQLTDDTAEERDPDAVIDIESEMPAGLKGQQGERLREHVALARQLATEQPDRAVSALRRMLAVPNENVAEDDDASTPGKAEPEKEAA
ncbi:flagellar basal-body MS-ring/collar protein FliF [Croceicoccus hydrothermalis]|uniref:flagellar basal-body MS-ring/collar protein FliF n=1 Tax=Croceicoccus hydrothermalis TaxID=2867964 RepID=UPI001EFBACAB|nr:flagellar basal-body MS-ring/collar protein FliF [Croceicoccus hydrothermalis]